MATSKGRVIDRVADILKCARSRWVTAGDVAERLHYAKADHVRLVLKRATEAGLLEERERSQRDHGQRGGNPLEYRVAPEWRNDA